MKKKSSYMYISTYPEMHFLYVRVSLWAGDFHMKMFVWDFFVLFWKAPFSVYNSIRYLIVIFNWSNHLKVKMANIWSPHPI